MKCEICQDNGRCKNLNGEGDLYDCCDYIEMKENKSPNTWMKNWMYNLIKKEQEPYESNFVKWSKKYD